MGVVRVVTVGRRRVEGMMFERIHRRWQEIMHSEWGMVVCFFHRLSCTFSSRCCCRSASYCRDSGRWCVDGRDAVTRAWPAGARWCTRCGTGARARGDIDFVLPLLFMLLLLILRMMRRVALLLVEVLRVERRVVIGDGRSGWGGRCIIFAVWTLKVNYCIFSCCATYLALECHHVVHGPTSRPGHYALAFPPFWLGADRSWTAAETDRSAVTTLGDSRGSHGKVPKGKKYAMNTGSGWATRIEVTRIRVIYVWTGRRHGSR